MATWDDGPGRLPDPDTPGLIPDDASALEPDRLAWLAEQGGAAPAPLWATSPPPARLAASPVPHPRGRDGDLLLVRQRHRPGVPGSIVVICLLAVGLLGMLAVTLITRPGTPDPAPAQLAQVTVAQVTAAADGPSPATVEQTGGAVIGHRLPSTLLTGDVRPISSQELRPAVLILLPAATQVPSPQLSADVAHAIYQQAREFRLPMWLIAGARPDGTDAARTYLTLLDEDAASGGARWAIDEGDGLSTTLAARGPTLVAVRADGVILGLRRDLPLDPGSLPALEPLFARLAIPTR